MWGAILAFVRKQIGLPGDTASSTGSVHAKLTQLHSDLLAGFVPGGMVASDNLKFSDDTETTYAIGSSAPYAKKRAIRVYRNGNVRVAFDGIRVEMNAFYAKIYIDGVAVGTERTLSSTYQTFTEDFAVAANSTIEIWVNNTIDSSGSIKLRNFRLYFDTTTTEAAGAGKVC